MVIIGVYVTVTSLLPIEIETDMPKFLGFPLGLFMIWMFGILGPRTMFAQRMAVTKENLEIYIFKHVEEGELYNKLSSVIKPPPVSKYIIPLAEIQMYGLFLGKDIAPMDKELGEKLEGMEMILPVGGIPLIAQVPEFIKGNIDVILVRDKSGQCFFARSEYTKGQIKKIFKAIEERTGIIPTKI